MSGFIVANQVYTFVRDMAVGESISSDRLFPHFFDEFSLEQAGVIRREWRLAEKPINSPFPTALQGPLVQFKYENNITVRAEMLRCLIRQDGSEGPNIHDLASKLLTHVEKSGLAVDASGFNVGLQMAHPEPEKYIYEHFVHSAFSSKVSYPVNNAIVSASLGIRPGVNLNLNIIPQRSGTLNILDIDAGEGTFVYIDANFDYRLTKESTYDPQETIKDSSKNMDILREMFDF